MRRNKEIQITNAPVRALFASSLLLAVLGGAPGVDAQERAERNHHGHGDARDDRGLELPRIEPHAGTWRTWVIPSGKDYLVPPPPAHRESEIELKTLAGLMSRNDAQVQQQIEFWDAGAPAYRWITGVRILVAEYQLVAESICWNLGLKISKYLL